MTKKLILFAQTDEATATLRVLKASPIPECVKEIWSEGAVPTLYEYEKGWIAITNIGCHYAQHVVSSHPFPFDEIWNLGFAGSLQSHVDIGTIIEVGTIGKFSSITHSDDLKTQEFLAATLPQFTINGQPCSLISSDFPIHDLALRTSLAKKWDLVDMEGYGIAFAAHHLGKKCRMWKIISDFASPGGRDLMRQNKAQLSERLAELIIRENV